MVVGNFCCAPLASVQDVFAAQLNAVPMLLSQNSAGLPPSPPVVLQSPKCQTMEPEVSTITIARAFVWFCATARDGESTRARKTTPAPHRRLRFINDGSPADIVFPLA